MSYCNNDEWEGEYERRNRYDYRNPIAQRRRRGTAWIIVIALIMGFLLAVVMENKIHTAFN